MNMEHKNVEFWGLGEGFSRSELLLHKSEV